GWTGALHALPELPEERLVSAGVWRRGCRPGDVRGNGGAALRRLSHCERGCAALADGEDGTPSGDEARDLRAHIAGACLRRGPLSAAAGHEHFTGPDRECAHAGDAG